MYPILFWLGPLAIPTFGIFAILAFLSASFVIWKRARETHFSEEEIFDAIGGVTLVGLLGARLVYVIFHFYRFGFWPLGWLSFVRIPGMTFSGGLAAGVLALFFFSRRKHWDFFEVSDIFVTGLSLAQAIGWMGAFFSGTGVGRESKLGLLFPGYETPRFPAQFVWMLGFGLLFIYLYKVEQRYRTFEWYRAGKMSVSCGFLTFFYFIVFAVLELISLLVGTHVYWLWFPVNLFFGLTVLGLGLGGLYWRSGRESKEDWRGLQDFLILGFRKRIVAIRQLSRKAKGVVSRVKKS